MSNSQTLISFSEKPTYDQISKWWSDFEYIETKSFDSWDEALEWSIANDGYANGPSGGTVRPIFKNGSRWVMCDFSMLMFDDRKSLSAASSEMGDVYTAMTQGTAGSAGFIYYANGELVRLIDYVDGDVSTEGEVQSFENGIDIDDFYDRELNKLWVTIGHDGLIFDCDPRQIECYHFRDPREIRDEPAASVNDNAQGEKKPWWKLW